MNTNHHHPGGVCEHGHDHSPFAQPHLSSIWQCCQNGDVKRLRSLIESKNIDVNQVDESGYTMLHYAARNRHFEVVAYLLSCKANVNARIPGGLETPLHRAAFVGDEKIVRLLVENGADVSATNIDGKTAVDKALLCSSPSHDRIVVFLQNSEN